MLPGGSVPENLTVQELAALEPLVVADAPIADGHVRWVGLAPCAYDVGVVVHTESSVEPESVLGGGLLALGQVNVTQGGETTIELRPE